MWIRILLIALVAGLTLQQAYRYGYRAGFQAAPETIAYYREADAELEKILESIDSEGCECAPEFDDDFRWLDDEREPSYPRVN